MTAAVRPLPSRWDAVAEKVPDSLADLRGPATGTVELPLRLAWSGLRVFDLDDPRLRLSMYHVVLTEGRRQDVETYVCADHVLADWPRLRRLVARRLREAWEVRFTVLAGEAG
ncbi:hypothetical protein Misp01_00990 [Microtetraspora sp. NBRC 13810]|uniref:hypothetical protein n=1 Tax=Microtetraspora sp. NBRC 13810 TaxID=3030990 RepID=UPI0024A20FD5|nr:hypothetical protein [Microtetraspora sp. NBRC 13810]GLW04969.1 hypothetical protein Misp01_00990 [Microtetraspora sp. NBRC 13810]